MVKRLIALTAALFLAGSLAAAPDLHAQAPAPASKTTLVDINSASDDELKALPGIGEGYAKRIIANRPYQRKDQLVSRKVIPEATYNGIKDQIFAKQAVKKK